jgi:hypothetical protein
MSKSPNGFCPWDVNNGLFAYTVATSNIYIMTDHLTSVMHVQNSSDSITLYGNIYYGLDYSDNKLYSWSIGKYPIYSAPLPDGLIKYNPLRVKSQFMYFNFVNQELGIYQAFTTGSSLVPVRVIPGQSTGWVVENDGIYSFLKTANDVFLTKLSLEGNSVLWNVTGYNIAP